MRSLEDEHDERHAGLPPDREWDRRGVPDGDDYEERKLLERETDDTEGGDHD